MEITTSVSGPPHSASSTPATSSAEAIPTEKGTSEKGPSTVCRKGSCTSSECSRRWAAPFRVTCGSASARAAAAPSMGTAPSGVRKTSSSGSASPARAS